MGEKAVSGFIIPTFGDTRQQGYFLQNGGYYFALSDYYDLSILGDYYTNGSYALRFESGYAKRYKFNGRVNIRFENQYLANEVSRITLNQGSTIFNGRMDKDAKASPIPDFQLR